MLFNARIIYTGTNGSRIVTVSKVKRTYVAANNHKVERTVYTTTGEDKRNARVIYLPPAHTTKRAAMHCAMVYLLSFSL
jgi:hypothetical protein